VPPFDIRDQQTNFGNHDFCDSVDEYMEGVFSLNFHLCLHRENQKISLSQDAFAITLFSFDFAEAQSSSPLI
jgi:hypothetical protein